MIVTGSAQQHGAQINYYYYYYYCMGSLTKWMPDQEITYNPLIKSRWNIDVVSDLISGKGKKKKGNYDANDFTQS